MIRIPRMHGRPPRFPASMVMSDRQDGFTTKCSLSSPQKVLMQEHEVGLKLSKIDRKPPFRPGTSGCTSRFRKVTDLLRVAVSRTLDFSVLRPTQVNQTLPQSDAWGRVSSAERQEYYRIEVRYAIALRTAGGSGASFPLIDLQRISLSSKSSIRSYSEKSILFDRSAP